MPACFFGNQFREIGNGKSLDELVGYFDGFNMDGVAKVYMNTHGRRIKDYAATIMTAEAINRDHENKEHCRYNSPQTTDILYTGNGGRNRRKPAVQSR